MTLKPPTKTFPKLVMKEWPDKALIGEVRSLAKYLSDEGRPYSADVAKRAAKALSDFTRVLEGVEGQKRPQKDGSRDE